jgi:hypothetical protein
MKKGIILAMAFSCFALTANAVEYWIIKDGKLNEKITQMPYEEEKVYDVLVDGDTYTGASYKHNESPYKDVRLDLSQLPISLKGTWVMEMEYKLPETAFVQDEEPYLSLVNNKSPMFVLGLWGKLPKQIDVSKPEVNFYIDGKFQAQPNTWIKAQKILYANPSFDSCKVMVISYCREIDKVLDPAYIKNLKFTNLDGCYDIFYSENFDGVGGAIPIYADNVNASRLKNEDLVGGKKIVSRDYVRLVRSWEEEGHDGSGFLDDENFHALSVPSGGEEIKIAGIDLPQDDIDGTIHLTAFIKNRYDPYKSFEIATDEERELPIYARFDNGREIRITKSLMNGKWSHIEEKIALPHGAKKMDIILKSNSSFDYLIDNIHLYKDMCSSRGTLKPRHIDFGYELNHINIPSNNSSSIYEASNNVEKIEVITSNGIVVLSEKGNKVNLDKLSTGFYIIKTYSRGGVFFCGYAKR